MGEVRPIVHVGDPVLHHPCEPVTRFDDELAALVDDMFASMYAADGVGLAACQIGVDRAVFVFDCHDASGERTVGVVCNPELTLPEVGERQLDDDDEGCLSLPGAFVPLARPDYAAVEGTDLEGNPVRYTGTGLLARCLQHETDHCNGTVFGDRLNRRARKKLQTQHDRAAEEFPEGWPA
jgi:peptide deformylase